MNILVVDDVPINRRLLRAMLEAEGFTVVEAGDGIEAMEQLKQVPIDAMISDILMPRMDGYRLCMELRKKEQFRHLPIVIYTSTYTSPSDRKIALEMGANRFLKKPSPAVEIVATLREVIQSAPLNPPKFPAAADEPGLIEQYNLRLVEKLTKKNDDLEAKSAALVAAESKFRNLVEQSVVGIYIVQDDRFVYVNPKMAELLGYSAAELTSRPLSDFCHPDDWPTAKANVEKRLSGEIKSAQYHLRYRYKNGSYIDVEVRGGATEYQGRPAIMDTLLDVSERQRAEAKINSQLRELERWRDVTLGREERILALKREVNALLEQAGKPPRYRNETAGA